jgi:hypothetical protein
MLQLAEGGARRKPHQEAFLFRMCCPLFNLCNTSRNRQQGDRGPKASHQDALLWYDFGAREECFRENQTD